jgi:hypothetical protein
MTTRRWMIAVAVVALVMGGYGLKRRRDDFLSRVQVHAEEATWRLEDSVMLCSRAVNSMDDIELARWKRRIAILPQLIAYHKALAQKYRGAARYPWLPIEPDPPEPE